MYSSSAEIISYIIIFCSVFILALSIFIILIVSIYKKKQSSYTSEIKALIATHENEMLKVQVEIQEQTFQNISRDIHDNVGQKLALAKLQIINMPRYDQAKITTAGDIISTAIADLRNLSRMLSSDIIQESGLIHAIEYEKEQLEKINLFNLDFEVIGEAVFLSAKRELILFRIIQEALQNIIKHTSASRVSILLEYGKKSLTVDITDDGEGFNELKHSGQGLKNMKARALLLDGICSIESELGKGTSIKIIIPKDQHDEAN